MRIGIRILLAAPRRLSGITALALILAAGCGGQAGDGGADAEPPAPVPAAEPTVAVETERVVYGKYEEQEITGLLARPVAGDGPAVVLIHDRWGLDENVEEIARRLAGEGFVALAVDFFGGGTATDPEGASQLVAAVESDRRAARWNLVRAHRYLERRFKTEKTGVIGWGFGGHWALSTAGYSDAAVVYYGRPFFNREQLEALVVETPILGVFGSEDQDIPIANVRRFESVLEELGKSAEIQVYEGAGRGFADPSSADHDAEAAADAWQKTLVFLRRHLQ